MSSALRLRSSVTPHESRPPIGVSPNKKTSLLTRLTPKRTSGGDSGSPASRPFASLRSTNLRSSRSPRASSNKMPASPNLMLWLETDCPQDLLPKILAFAGPQVTAVFGRTNRFWRGVVNKESTWRSLCEDLYKWKQGDAVPESWRAFYRFNPCVPVDFPSINSALALVRTHRMEQIHSIRVLLRPGKYYLREAITIQAPSSVHVEIETMQLPASIRTTVEPPMEPEISSRRRSSTSLRNILSCRSVEVEEPEIEDVPPEFPEALPNSTLANPTAPRRASLILRTRRLNEPLIRVRQGRCTIRSVELRHICHGIDIWNGNAAVQIQPPVGSDDRPLMVMPVPTCILDRVEVSSSSGRGIVNIDGGLVTIRKCYVHDCAATGIYVGGPGSRAVVEETDVVRNGNGNSLHRRGIARGHSGIYLEQGRADIKNCNVSKNSLTGISAVSPDNAFLNLSMSDLVANGTYQLEMPAVGTVAHRESVTQNNNLATVGKARSRSGLVIEE